MLVTEKSVVLFLYYRFVRLSSCFSGKMCHAKMLKVHNFNFLERDNVCRYIVVKSDVWLWLSVFKRTGADNNAVSPELAKSIKVFLYT